jgi:hypothetical protein
MPSRLAISLAVSLAGLALAGLGGCCCPPVCDDGSSGHLSHGGHGPHSRVLRKGTLPPLVPAPAVASPIPRYHPLPTHPVFEPQEDYSAFAPLSHDRPLPHDPQLSAPELLAPMKGEPTPALLPPESDK